MKRGTSLLLTLLMLWGLDASAEAPQKDYERARWDPIHFPPAVHEATNEQCLACHQEILSAKPRQVSPAGVKAVDTLAWYQTLDTYEGAQESFHWRHLESPLAKKVMNLDCVFCHQGNDPREEAPVPPTAEPAGFNLRKAVDPSTTCLRCHGGNNYQVMGLPGPWPESRALMQDSCVLCHAGIRTNRHKVSYLNAAAIEEAGKTSSDTCYGCHGGRQWYRINYPYPRNPWPGMAKDVPEWAKDRATESDEPYRLKEASK
ncbi:MAG: hypothetical protein G8D28_03205 [gamma proteobacterium symbiont of Phacoides pectinatus]